MKHSDETKDKIRKASIGNKNMLNKKHTDETKNKIRNKLKGIPLSKETKDKMSKSRKGRIVSKETRDKLRQASVGREVSDETRNKQRLAKLGKKQSKETIEHRVKLNTGKKRTQETKDKISQKLMGIKRGSLSNERKKQISKQFSKRVALISNNNEIIKEYDSLRLCALDLGIDSRRISDVLCGRINMYREYKFKYI